MNDLVIVGTGGHGREAMEIVLAMNARQPRFRLIGFLDDNTAIQGTQVKGAPVLGGISWLRSAPADLQYVLAVGSCPARARLSAVLDACPSRPASIVHPAASVGSDFRHGEGLIIAPGAIVTTNVRVGRHTHINSGAVLAHDDTLGDFVHVAPGAHVAGTVSIGDGCDIGIGATIIQSLHIGEWSIVGASACVVTPLEANVTAVGVPARVIRRREPGWWR